jgi:hypothetical protein
VWEKAFWDEAGTGHGGSGLKSSAFHLENLWIVMEYPVDKIPFGVHGLVENRGKSSSLGG